MRTGVPVEKNQIKKVNAVASDAHAEATVVDAPGMVLMPGLIDSHVHINGYVDGNILTWQNTTWEEIGARAAFHQRR